MSKSFTPESKSILASIDKILQTIKTIEQSAQTPKASLEQLLKKNVPSSITNLNENIKEVIQKADPIFSKETNTLFNKLQTLKTPLQLQTQQNVKEIISSDLKSILIQAQKEIEGSSHTNKGDLLRNIDKLSLQIDNYQLLSHLSNGTMLYLPFSWDALKDGNIELKKSDDEKFYCDIDLKLEEYGDLNLKLTLFEKNNLNLHIYSSSEEFKEIVKDELPALRSALIDAQIVPREIRVFEPKKELPTSPYQEQEDNIYMGFEVKA